MKCASCRKSISIIQLLVGHKDCRAEDQEREVEQLGIQRLLNAATEPPDRLNVVKSENISILPQSVVMPGYWATQSQTSTTTKKSPDVEPELGTPVIECSRAYGSWRCRCPHCTGSADKVQVELAVSKKYQKLSDRNSLHDVAL